MHLNQPGRKRMRFYQVHLWSEQDSSEGFEYFTTKKEALARKREWESREVAFDMYRWPGVDEVFGPFEPDELIEFTAILKVIDIEPNKRGILDALNDFASHPDNGGGWE
jgi:hypothetical protein